MYNKLTPRYKQKIDPLESSKFKIFQKSVRLQEELESLCPSDIYIGTF